jgi:hypothetical protein
MHHLNVSTLPIYLPYDEAHVPFGDVFEDVTCTSASPGVFTVPGYVPVLNDQVAITYLEGGSMPGGITYGQGYYVVSPSNDTFELSATEGGSAINTTSTGADLVAHLLSGQIDGVTLPFKPNNTCVVLNLTANSTTLQGAADSGQATPGQGYNPPAGPGSWSTIVTVAGGAAALAQLNYDWIRVTASGTLVLLQN